MPDEKKRSIVYIDGFNLYYGTVRDTPWKWLNIQSYFERLRQDDDIQAIKYFTAIVQNDRHARNRQCAFLAALGTLPKVQILEGRFKPKRVTCRVRGCHFRGSRTFNAPEEKQTDVSIGVHMIDDAYRDACDRLIVVSGDSDLLPALDMVKLRFPQKKITVYVPARDRTRGAAVELRRAAHRHLTLPNSMIKDHLFPDLVITENLIVAKPVEW